MAQRSCRAFFFTSVVHRYEDTRPNKENQKAVTVDPAALKMLPRAELRQYINDVGWGQIHAAPMRTWCVRSMCWIYFFGRYLRLKLQNSKKIKKEDEERSYAPA